MTSPNPTSKTATTIETAAARAAVGGARDATCLEPQQVFFRFLTLRLLLLLLGLT